MGRDAVPSDTAGQSVGGLIVVSVVSGTLLAMACAGAGESVRLYAAAGWAPWAAAAGAMALAAICWRFPLATLCALLALLPCFGNRPDRSPVEWLDIALISWLAGASFRVRPWGSRAFARGWEWIFVLTGVASLVANGPAISVDAQRYSLHPVSFLVAGESQPQYMIRAAVMLAVCVGIAQTVVVMQERCSPKTLACVVWAVGIGVAVVLAVAVAEFLSPDVRAALDDVQRRVGGFSDRFPFYPELTPWIPEWMRRLSGGNTVKSLFWNRGWMTVYLVAALPFCLAWAMSRRRSRATVILVLAAVTAVMIASAARGGLAAVAVAWLCLMMGWLLRRRPVAASLCAVGGAGVIALGALVIIVSAETGRQRLGWLYPHGRTEIYRYALDRGRQFWYCGIGIEGLGWWAELHDPDSVRARYPYKRVLATAHNQFLQVFAGQGLLGLAVFVILAAAALWAGVQGAFNPAQPRSRGISAGFAVGWIAVIVYMATQEWFYLRAVQLLWWLAIAFMLRPRRAEDTAAAASRRTRRVVQAIIVAGAAAGAIAGVARTPVPPEWGLSFPEPRDDPDTRRVFFWRWFAAAGRLAVPPEAVGFRITCQVHTPWVSPKRPAHFTIAMPEAPQARFTFIDDRIQQREFLMPDAGTDVTAERFVDFSCDETWSPVEIGRSRHTGRLGVFAAVVFLTTRGGEAWLEEARSRLPMERFETVRPGRWIGLGPVERRPELGRIRWTAPVWGIYLRPPFRITEQVAVPEVELAREPAAVEMKWNGRVVDAAVFHIPSEVRRFRWEMGEAAAAGWLTHHLGPGREAQGATTRAALLPPAPAALTSPAPVAR